MGMVFEIIFDLIIDGSFGAVSDKKAPMALRVAAAVLLAALYIGVIVFCAYMAIHEKSWIAAALGILVLVVTIPESIKAFRKNRERKE